MDVVLGSFGRELVKLAAEREKKKSYPAAVVAALPFAASKSLADIPKGMVDKGVDSTVRTGKPGKLKGIALRGAGRAAGSLGPGAATAPLFLSGLKDIKEGKTKEERRRGAAKVVGSGALYSVGKGGVEAATEALGEGKVTREALKRVGDVASVRGAIGTAAAAATAVGVGKSLRKPKKGEKKKSTAERVAVPAAIGAGVGAGKGALEELWTERKNLARKGKSLADKKVLGRGVAAKATGRAASGVLGAVALSELARATLKKGGKEKGASGPTDLYGQVQGWAHSRPDADIVREYNMIRSGLGERSPSSRAAYYALHDELERRGHRLPPPGMRGQVTDRQIEGPGRVDMAAAVAVAAAPALVWNLGFAGMTPTDKDMILADAVDRMFVRDKFVRLEAAKSPYGGYESSHEIGTKNVYLPPPGEAHPEDIAHEVGHAGAGELRKKTIGSVEARIAYRAGQAAAVAIPLIALASAQNRSFSTPKELESRARFVESVGLVSTLLMAPSLAEEATASIQAAKMLHQAGAPAEEVAKRSLKRLVPAFATHAGPVAVPVAVAAMLRARAKSGEKRR